MKKYILVFFILLNTINYFVLAQTTSKKEKVKIIEITPYKEAYLIIGLSENLDSLTIISPKRKNINKCKYNKIQKGVIYEIEFRERGFYVDNLTIRIDEKILWQTGDNFQKMPYYANNMIDIYIKKE